MPVLPEVMDPDHVTAVSPVSTMALPDALLSMLPPYALPVTAPNSTMPVPKDCALFTLTCPAVMVMPPVTPPMVLALMRFTTPPALLMITLPAVAVPP